MSCRLSCTALALLLCACTTAIEHSRPASSCTTLIPKAWLEPTPGAPLPLAGTLGDWVQFGNAQTGALDLANASKAGMVEIITNCERRDAELVKELTRKRRFLGLF